WAVESRHFQPCILGGSLQERPYETCDSLGGTRGGVRRAFLLRCIFGDRFREGGRAGLRFTQRGNRRSEAALHDRWTWSIGHLARRTRHRPHGGVRLRRTVSGGSRETGGDGRVPPGRRGVGNGVQQSGYLAFPFQRANPGSLGSRARAAVL